MYNFTGMCKTINLPISVMIMGFFSEDFNKDFRILRKIFRFRVRFQEIPRFHERFEDFNVYASLLIVRGDDAYMCTMHSWRCGGSVFSGAG